MRLAPLLLVLVALAACLSTGTPEGETYPAWVDQPDSHPRCRPSLYLCGVGSARGLDDDARALSRQRALEAIVASIVVEVQSTVELDSVTHRENDEVSWSETIAETIRVTTPAADLPGAEIIETWRAPRRRETYTLVSVRRDHLLDTYLPEVTAALVQAETLLAAADNGVAPTVAIRNTLLAYQVLTSAYGLATRAKVVGAPAPFGQPAIDAFAATGRLLVDASNRLAGFAGSMRITIIAGDGQVGFARGGLPEAIVARVEYEDGAGRRQPLPDLPMMFFTRIAGSASLNLTATTTDQRGEISAFVSDLGPTGKSSNEIIVRPDFGRAAPSLDGEHLPSAAFSYRLPTPGQTRVLVSIAETFDRGALQNPFLAEHLADHLSAFGFDARTDRSQGVDPTALAGRRPAELRNLLGSNFDYVIRGTAHARISSRDQGLVWFRADAQVQIVELRTGLSQVVSTDEVRTAYVNDSESGAMKVMGTLRKELRDRIEEAFVSLFLPARAAG